MQISEISYTDARPIDGYGPGFFRVGGQVYEGTQIVTASTVIAWEGYGDTETPLALQHDIDILLVGTGETLKPIPAPFRNVMDTAGVGVEPMASASACRTFNILLAEGRRVAAALLPI